MILSPGEIRFEVRTLPTTPSSMKTRLSSFFTRLMPTPPHRHPAKATLDAGRVPTSLVPAGFTPLHPMSPAFPAMSHTALAPALASPYFFQRAKLPPMNLPHPTRLLLLLALACPALPAAEKLDLKRDIPVAATQQIPIQDFFRPRVFVNPKLNPSGTHIGAQITGGADHYYLMTIERTTSKTETLVSQGDTDIGYYEWLNDKRLVFQLNAEKMHALGMLGTDLGTLNRPYPLLMYCGPRLIAIPPANRTRPLIQMDNSALEGGARELVAVTINTDVQTGGIFNATNGQYDQTDVSMARDNNRRHILKSQPGVKGPLGTGFMADLEGSLEYAFTASDGIPQLHLLKAGNWQACPIDLDLVNVIGPGRQRGELVVASAPRDGQPGPLQYMDAATGTPGDVLIQDKGYDFAGWVYRDRVTHQIVGAHYDRAGPHTVWFNEDYAAVQKLLNAQFAGLRVQIIDNNEAGNLFLVATYSDKQPVIYHWVDLANRSAGLIKNSAPWIDPARMQPMVPLKFKTRDGLSLDAYVTLPAGATKQNPPPLVVLSHGGPWARDTWGFNGEVQFLASRGYAVLQTNYRGSTGSDWMIPYEQRFDFIKMHEDVTDAARTLIKSGLVDPKRVAIMGASFGAYLALSGVTREPAMYRCAVVNAGVFDWEEVIRETKFNQYDNPQFAYLVRHLGDPKKEKEKFEAMSPGRHVANVRVPVFVAHGKDDPVAPVAESRRLVNELQKHKVPHETLFKGGEGHGMGHLDSQVELYGRIEAFLAKNLMAAP